MKLIAIPPYRLIKYTNPAEWGAVYLEIIADMREKGQLEGVEIDLDKGHATEHSAETRDEEILAGITVGFLKRVRICSEMGTYDAIVSPGGMEPGFLAARQVSKLPFAGAVHASFHVASLLGDRFSVIGTVDPVMLMVRRHAQIYGLDQKLASLRGVSYSSSFLREIIIKYKKEERVQVPEAKKFVDDTVAQCIVAIEKDRADCLIIGNPGMQCFEDDIRQRLAETGYAEIQLIGQFQSAVEMARAMVNMKLVQAPRAYPSDYLKAKPEFR